MLTPEQRAVLASELSDPVYAGKTAEQAQRFLTAIAPVRLSSGAIKALGHATQLDGQIVTSYCRACGGITREHPAPAKCPCGGPYLELARSPQSLSMPNAFDPTEFAEVFAEARR